MVTNRVRSETRFSGIARHIAPITTPIIAILLATDVGANVAADSAPNAVTKPSRVG